MEATNLKWEWRYSDDGWDWVAYFDCPQCGIQHARPPRIRQSPPRHRLYDGRVRPRPIVPQAAVWLPRGANALPTLAYGFSGALNAR